MTISIDLYEADEVEVVIVQHQDGWRLWVNVEGRNRLRIYRIQKVYWRDHNGDD